VKNRGLVALEAPPKCKNHEIHEGPIYKQNEMYCQVR
jgi:hypothetical protein